MTEYSADYLNQHQSYLSRNDSAESYTGVSLFTPPTSPAKAAYQRLARCIAQFEETCADEQEIGVRLVADNTPGALYLRELFYYEPNILLFHGINENGEVMQLIQDASQLNVLLVPLDKRDEHPVRLSSKLQNDPEA